MRHSMHNSGGTTYMKSLNRALSILECFTPQQNELAGAEIAQKVGLHKTTVYRMLQVLISHEMIGRNTRNRKYTVGPMLYVLGSLYLNTIDFLKAAEPVIKTINDLTSEAVNLSIFEKGNVVIVMKEESKHSYRIAVHIGSTLAAHASAMGKAFLSEMSDMEIDTLYPDERLQPLTKKTITTKSELKLALQDVRKTGISFTKGETYEWGEGIASLIRNAAGKAIAAMSFSVPSVRMDNDEHKLLGTLIKLASSLVSFRLGYQDEACSIRNIEEMISWWEQSKLDSGS